MKVEIHPRVAEKHQELTEHDIRYAVLNTIKSLTRTGTDPLQVVGVGPDRNGRILQWVGNRVLDDPADADSWFIYHALPVTMKVLYELEMI